MDENKHTKFVEISQDRVWRCLHYGRWAYTWEDGYDALAYVEMTKHGQWHWWTQWGRSGFALTFEEAKRETGYA
jgi:hypothetical protein